MTVREYIGERMIWPVTRWIARNILIGPNNPYEKTLYWKLHAMVGLWEQEAEWIDGYVAAGCELMDCLDIEHKPPDATQADCPQCNRIVWRLDNYCAHCGAAIRTQDGEVST